MRELKFRGKSEITGEWVTGTYIEGYIINGIIEANSEYIVIEDWKPVYPESVGQYTGLKNKNGIEIYEGDIIENDREDAHEAVTFDEGSFWLEGSTYTSTLNEVDANFLEIIGNLYDNPELIK